MKIRHVLKRLKEHSFVLSLYEIARLMTSIRAIVLLLFITVIFLGFLRFASESLASLLITLPARCFDAKDGPTCQSAILSFYNLHDLIVGGEPLQTLLLLRPVALLLLGSVIPLIVYILNLGDPIIALALRPYFYLIIAHGISLLLGNILVGEGILVWIGALYSLLRSVQLLVIIPRVFRGTSELVSNNKKRNQYRLFATMLCILLCLWLFNSIYLWAFIFLTTIGLLMLPLHLESS